MKGFSLVELLIAMFILSVSLLALYKAQITALRSAQHGYWYSFAVQQLTAIIESFGTENQLQLIQLQQHTKRELPQGQLSLSKNKPKITWQEPEQQVTIQTNWED